MHCSAGLRGQTFRTSLHAGVRYNTNGPLPLKSLAVRNFEDIPGPKPLPVIGNLWRYLPFLGEYSFKRIHRTYEKMYYQYGPLIKEKVFADRVVVHVYEPEDMKKVYNVEEKDIFRKSHRALGKYRRERPHLYNGAGLFPSNGEEWSKFRRLFEQVFLDIDKDQGLSRVLETVTDDLVTRIPHVLDRKSEVDIQPEIFKWAVECIGAVTLNTRLGCLSIENNNDVAKFVKAAQVTQRCVFLTELSPFYKYFRTPTYKKLEKAQDYVSSVVTRYMGEAIAVEASKAGSPSVLTKLLGVEGADFKDVFTMVVDMFLAGTDGTSYAVAFALYNLAKHQSVQEKLRKELLRVYPEKNKPFGNLLESDYLRAVVKETLRVSPVAFGNGRIIPYDMILSGYRVKKGTQVLLQHQVASKLEKNFPGAAFFRPERWLQSENSEVAQLQNIASSPYGLGPRTCMGAEIAEKELSLAIGKIIRSFRVEYHYDDIDSVNRLVNIPDRQVKIRFYPVD